jgi:hypothetical protein
MPDRWNNYAYVDRLSDALVNIVNEDRIGVPRFIRWLQRVGADGSVDDSVAVGIEACNRVFGSEPMREYRTGDDLTHVTVHAVWASGASALISAGPAGSQVNAGTDVVLLGSSGAVYFDGANGGAATVVATEGSQKVGGI